MDRGLDAGEWLCVKVEDNGIGITEPVRRQLFEAFFQAPREPLMAGTVKQEGTGLGLAISQQLARKMGGEISCESTPGEGSRFILRLPHHPVCGSKRVFWMPDVALLSGKKLLIVDPEPAHRNLLSAMAREWGMQTMAVPGAALALELLPSFQAEVVMIAEQLPEMTGYSLAQQVRRLYGNDQKLILSSSRREALSTPPRHADRIVVHPIRMQTFFSLLSQMLGGGSELAIGLTSPDASLLLDSAFAAQYPLKVLVVEDHPMNQKVICTLLGKLGYVADKVSDGAKALEAWAAGRHDFILMDLEMPVMDGFEATRRLRLADGGQQTVVVALTANVLTDCKDRCREAGMNDYLSKPVRIPELKRVIRSAAGTIGNGVPMNDQQNLTSGEWLDVLHLEALMGDRPDPDFMAALLGGFGNRFELHLIDLSQKASLGDIEGQRKLLHLLKGTTANGGMLRLSAAITRIQDDLKSKGTIPSAADLEELRALAKGTLAALRERRWVPHGFEW
jgi:CheY-like chemotaxis protein